MINISLNELACRDVLARESDISMDEDGFVMYFVDSDYIIKHEEDTIESVSINEEDTVLVTFTNESTMIVEHFGQMLYLTIHMVIKDIDQIECHSD